MSMCEGICSNGHLYSLFYKIKSEIRSITCVSIVSVNISIGNGGERVYREQKDKVHMHAAVHTKTEGICGEKQSNGHAHALADTSTHRTRDKTSVSNRWERMGIGTEGERDHRGHEQKHTHPDTLGGRNNDGEKRSEKEPLSKEGMHENTSTERTRRGGTNTQQTAKEERRGEE